MSYILEALKKSQLDRKIKVAPPLLVDPDPLPGPPRNANRWNLIALILAFAALLTALYGTLRSQWFEPARQLSLIEPSSSDGQVNDSMRNDELPPRAESEKERSPVSHAESDVSETIGVGRMASETHLSQEQNLPAEGRSNGKPLNPEPANGEMPETLQDNSGDKKLNVANESPNIREPMKLSAASEAATATFGAKAQEPEKPVRAFLQQEAEKLREKLETIAPFQQTTAVTHRKEKQSAGDLLPTGTDVARSSASDEAEAEATAANALPRPDDLPPDIVRTLPDRKIIVHVYNRSRDERYIVMNSQKMREGEKSTEGLFLESILSNGTILRFKNHRFFQPR